MEDGGVPMLLTEKSETLKRSITASKLAALRFFLVGRFGIIRSEFWGLFKESRDGRGRKKGASPRLLV